MRTTSTRLLTSLSFFALLATSAFAAGIKHPSDYGSPPSAIDFGNCGTTQVGLVVADCFTGTGPGFNDFLFNVSLKNPDASTSITSLGFTFADVPTDVGLLEGTPSDCAAMNIPCTPASISITNNPALSSPITLEFSGFTGNLSATIYFAYSDQASAPVFTADTTSGSVTPAPEPSEIGILVAGLGCLIAAQRKLQLKRNS
ncbi:MAG TPA: hypothetical protein VKT81_03510 [Bryobacteraceae bacterium]|nr:hypothetical protein [Bryobacteraceae bacterium]